MRRKAVDRVLVSHQIKALFLWGRVTGRRARRWLRDLGYQREDAALLVTVWRLGRSTRHRRR